VVRAVDARQLEQVAAETVRIVRSFAETGVVPNAVNTPQLASR